MTQAMRDAIAVREAERAVMESMGINGNILYDRLRGNIERAIKRALHVAAKPNNIARLKSGAKQDSAHTTMSD